MEPYQSPFVPGEHTWKGGGCEVCEEGVGGNVCVCVLACLHMCGDVCVCTCIRTLVFALMCTCIIMPRGRAHRS